MKCQTREMANELKEHKLKECWWNTSSAIQGNDETQIKFHSVEIEPVVNIYRVHKLKNFQPEKNDEIFKWNASKFL